MIEEIIKNKSLYEDELLLLIRKGNERAEELFFSAYETILRIETQQFRTKFRLPAFSEEDMYQEIKLSFLECIKTYNFKQGKFYSFFKIVCKRELFRVLKNQTVGSNDSRKFETYDENFDYTFESRKKSIKFEDECMNILEGDIDKKDIFTSCLKLWLNGYSYKEIGDFLNITVPSVNYHIRKKIDHLRSILNIESDEESK